MNKLISIILGLFLGTNYYLSQGLKEVSYPDYINGVSLYNPQTNDNTPIIRLGEQLILRFDDLRNRYQSYSYTISRYTHDWEPSEAFTNDYLVGFSRANIRDYQHSFNTMQSYIHYNLSFPNNDIDLKLSGNYAIKVFGKDKKKPLIIKRFAVVEDLAQLNVRIVQSNDPSYTDQKQQVKFDAFFDARQLDLTQNINDVHAIIMKNNNWKEGKYTSSPDFVSSQKITFSSFNYNFFGGNEYRWFDTKLIDIKAASTDALLKDTLYHHYLKIDEDRSGRKYYDNPDMNGNFYIRTVDQAAKDNINTQADYVWVHFALAHYNPSHTYDVYIVGAFNDWQLADKYKLSFNETERYYEHRLLLKQGTYNYLYQYVDKATGEIIADAPEGNFWQTENQYQVLLYYRPWGKRYDLLIGYSGANTRLE